MRDDPDEVDGVTGRLERERERGAPVGDAKRRTPPTGETEIRRCSTPPSTIDA